MAKMLATTLLLVLLLPAMAAAQKPRKDLEVFNDVAREVTRYTRFTVFDDVSANVEGGVVTLEGRVTMPYKVDDIVRLASRVEGVTTVRSLIKVLPVSFFDDELRYRISRAIYGNPGFWHYAAMANPPIHIVVENGRVTLTGVVNSNVERMMAQSLATSFNAFAVVNNLKTDAEAKADLERMD